jgi:hypothetical protein
MKPNLSLELARGMFSAALMIAASPAFAQSSAFTYQGRLEEAGAPVNGLHDLRFRLFDAASGGVQVGSTMCLDNVNLNNGLFTAQLDFGQQFVTTAQRHLEIELRSDTGLNCSNTSGFTLLAPRQLLTATPLANHAKSAFALDAADGTPANAVFVDNAGKVGIGTTTPLHPVHIATSAQPVMIIQDTGANSTQTGYIGFMNAAPAETGWLGFGYGEGNPDFGLVTARASGDINIQTLGTGGNINLLPNAGVGIGTTAPTAKLHVDGAVRVDINGFSENLHIHHSNGNVIWNMGVTDAAAQNPIFLLRSQISGDDLAGIGRYPDGISFVFADEKNFRVPNPADATTDIWYCCPEGPEAAMYVRGTARLVDGSARITLPEHFRNLAVEEGMTVQVTPLSADSRGLAITAKRLAGVEVRELAGGTGSYEFDWRVEAVRKGYENYQVIRPWMRSDEDESKAWDNRMKWIAERRDHGMP